MRSTQIERRSLDRGTGTRRSHEPEPPVWRGLTRMVEGPAAWLFTFLVFPVLLIAALLLPPVSLLDRLEAFTYTRISTAGGALRDPDGTLVSFPSEGIRAAFSAGLKSVPKEYFVLGNGDAELVNALKGLPDTLLPRSPVYQLRLRGDEPVIANLRIPIPLDSQPYETLGVYNWDGSRWLHLPARVVINGDEEVLEATLNRLPTNFMVMQTGRSIPAATINVDENVLPPQNAIASFEARAGLRLRGDGGLEGNLPQNTGKTLPVIRNWEGTDFTPKVIRTDLLHNLLLDAGLKDNHVETVVGNIVQNNYPGVIIDYRGVDALPSAAADYANLIQRIADKLHESGKNLAVRVELPTQVSADQWNTGGYDWPALSDAVDTLIIPALIDPRAYQAGTEMDALLSWATSQVDRKKIQIEFTGQSIERSGSYLLMKGYQQALQPLVQQVKSQNNGAETLVSLDNPNLLSAVTWDEAVGMYRYSYKDAQGLERTVYIENEGSFKHKLALLQKYNISNVNIMVPSSGDIDANLWGVLHQFQNGDQLSAERTPISVAYTALDGNNQPIATANALLENPQAKFDKKLDSNVKIKAQLADHRGKLLSIASDIMAVRQASTSATQPQSLQSAPQAAADSTVAAASPIIETAAASSAVATSGEAASKQASAASNEVAAAAQAPQIPMLRAAQLVNVRKGPGTTYQTLGQMAPNAAYKIMGKNPTNDWWQIDIGNGERGWVIGSLVETLGDMVGIAVANDIPELPQVVAAALPVAAAAAPTAVPAAAPTAAPADPAPVAPPPQAAPQVAAPAPVVSAPAPSGGIPFGYGLQAHVVDTSDGLISQVMGSVKGLGFGWVKSQVEWKRFEDSQGAKDFGPLDPIINQANASGLNVLFSVVNAPSWAREAGFDGSVGGPPGDPSTYASFVGALAGKYCGSSLKAIEVWNEQNLHYEWGNKPLNPGEYVQLLAQAYAAIKAACPSMYVVSGALTPAGNNGGKAVDDFQYLEGMFNAGANNYLDSVGAHPSGYNVPPSATWDTACNAIQASGNSFNGACDDPHHSWSFRSTMEGYRNIMLKYGASNKTIMATEFGWAAGGAFNPNYGYANDNDYGEQAQWTVEAYQMARSWGWAGPMILWNLNFRVVADGTEKAQWGIVKNDWTPLPVYNALQGMGK